MKELLLGAWRECGLQNCGHLHACGVADHLLLSIVRSTDAGHCKQRHMLFLLHTCVALHFPQTWETVYWAHAPFCPLSCFLSLLALLALLACFGKHATVHQTDCVSLTAYTAATADTTLFIMLHWTRSQGHSQLCWCRRIAVCPTYQERCSDLFLT